MPLTFIRAKHKSKERSKNISQIFLTFSTNVIKSSWYLLVLFHRLSSNYSYRVDLSVSIWRKKSRKIEEKFDRKTFCVARNEITQ